jgi:predicted ArsR family transcriptional regulator
MEHDPFAPDAPDIRDVLGALDDPDCRTIIERIDGAMTANDVAERCDIPLSTTYRKLELLTEASLLEEQVQLRADGRHTKRYVLAFEGVRITVGDDCSLEAAVERREQTPAERLSELWSEVGEET